ncbi:MAG: PD-(D/E)XK nuclease family protein, partial [Acidimicrobiia bacterium]|nr:PD-(D/E)XK nuclease family protein [Acidimicrobiia bacterium]
DRSAAPPVHSGMTDAQIKRELSEHNSRQEWRIAYVAVTRAMTELRASGAFWNRAPIPNKNPAKPSRLFELISETAGGGTRLDEPPDRPEVLGSTSGSAPAPDPLFDGSWPAALRRALADPSWPGTAAAERGLTETYDAAVDEMQQALFDLPEPLAPAPGEGLSVSTTGLVTYATCPKRYYWSEVDRLPRRISGAARRGIDVHRRIELHNLGVMPLDEAADYDLLSEDRVPSGSDPFGAYLGSRFAAGKPLMVETPFELKVGSAWVRGRIDAIYGDEEHWEVVDFKSGRPSADPDRLVQLQVYAMAANEVSFGIPAPDRTTVTFAFLGDGLHEISHGVDEAWLDSAAARVTDLIDGIGSGCWDARPSDACSKCDFLRHCPAGRDRVG